jgi:energy-coupling factor transporter ATP-binding protein EcfA2
MNASNSQGEVLIYCGPSGSGKTKLITDLEHLGLESPTLNAGYMLHYHYVFDVGIGKYRLESWIGRLPRSNTKGSQDIFVDGVIEPLSYISSDKLIVDADDRLSENELALLSLQYSDQYKPQYIDKSKLETSDHRYIFHHLPDLIALSKDQNSGYKVTGIIQSEITPLGYGIRCYNFNEIHQNNLSKVRTAMIINVEDVPSVLDTMRNMGYTARVIALKPDIRITEILLSERGEAGFEKRILDNIRVYNFMKNDSNWLESVARGEILEISIQSLVADRIMTIYDSTANRRVEIHAGQVISLDGDMGVVVTDRDSEILSDYEKGLVQVLSVLTELFPKQLYGELEVSQKYSDLVALMNCEYS